MFGGHVAAVAVLGEDTAVAELTPEHDDLLALGEAVVGPEGLGRPETVQRRLRDVDDPTTAFRRRRLVASASGEGERGKGGQERSNRFHAIGAGKSGARPLRSSTRAGR